ncbi:hypothetical protein KFL_000320200 [Klebsormidium nitens]|uniref:UVR domain-containing protein n=1 Tax=Klebsormidium nitens TaxID=105231 RepID=A0A1Y1HRA9_KLENI|nr:hypothetical protein KFL_000320200 [Klebsormidium nitens]|eukprot:GAQ79521.1 hypothetical protein KFL_000320200 [Klebsormidium nitens]
MFKRMFNAAKDLSEKRPEPDALAPEAEREKEPDDSELFAGMSFAQDVVLEESDAGPVADTNSTATPADANSVMPEADEGLFSGLSMVADPLAEAMEPSEQTDVEADRTGTLASALDDPKVSAAKAPQDAAAAGESLPPKSPPLASMRPTSASPPSIVANAPPMGVSMLKLPPVSTVPPTGNSAAALAALRPAVVRKKKRSMRVGYAREGDADDGAKGGTAPGSQIPTPSDGTPMSQSPRSSIGDVSELQGRGRDDEGELHDSHREVTGEGNVALRSGAERVGERDAGSETGARSVSGKEGGAGGKDLEEVQSKGMIAVVPSGDQAEPSEQETEKAKLAAEHIEEEREAVRKEEADQESFVAKLVEDDDSEENKNEPEAEGESSEAAVPDADPKESVPSEAALLPTAMSLEKVGTEEGEAVGEAIASEQGTAKGALQRLETDLDIERIALEEQLQEEPPPTVESLEGLPLPKQVAQVRQYVEKRLAIIREKVAGAIATKKTAVQKKREAAERAAEAAARVADLEQQVGIACDEEDFEKADELTKEIEGVEKEAAAATAAARAAEAESDSSSAQVQATAQEEVDVQLEGAALLRAVTASAHANALRAQESAEAAASEQESSLQQQEDDVAERRRKVGLELRVIEEENAALKLKIDETTRSEVDFKEELMGVKSTIEGELKALREAVARKELELRAQDEKIADVDSKIAEVAAKFGREAKGLQADEERVSSLAAQLEAELERVAEERRRVAAAVEEAASARRSLEETAARAELDAAQMEGQARHKQGAAAAVVASQRRKDELAEEEKKLREQAEAVRERLAGLRSSFQEVAVVKLRLQQELAAEEFKVEAANKRAPELEAEKKLAAQARNFKEAARLSAEAKALATEREKAEAEVGRLKGELGAAEGQEQTRAAEVAELETELSAKEREAATARCERLRLVAAAARREMDEAAEAEDFEEAGSLQAEAEAADAEAEQLKETHKLEGARFDVIEHVEAAEMGDDVSKDGGTGGDGVDEGMNGDDVSKERGAEQNVSEGRAGGKADVVAEEEEEQVANGNGMSGEEAERKLETEAGGTGEEAATDPVTESGGETVGEEVVGTREEDTNGPAANLVDAGNKAVEGE